MVVSKAELETSFSPAKSVALSKSAAPHASEAFLSVTLSLQSHDDLIASVPLGVVCVEVVLSVGATRL